MHKGLPVARPAQTLLDMASDLRFNQLRRALAEAEYQKLVTVDDVKGVLGRGKPGSAALRAALESHLPHLAQTRSHMEEVFAHLCDSHFHTQPRLNARIAGYIVDATWPAQKVVVEIDGRTAHSTARTIENDHRRDLDLRAAGSTVLRYTWRQLMQEPELVIADLRRHGVT
jgi:very-short-patch-repair endonuclease